MVFITGFWLVGDWQASTHEGAGDCLLWEESDSDPLPGRLSAQDKAYVAVVAADRCDAVPIKWFDVVELNLHLLQKSEIVVEEMICIVDKTKNYLYALVDLQLQSSTNSCPPNLSLRI